MSVALGKIVSPHGVRGELNVVAYSGSLEALEGRERVFLRLDGAEKPYRLRDVRRHRGAFLVTLAGVEGRNEARALVGAELALPEAELPLLEDDEYYWYQLIGLEVVTTSGQGLGRVADLISTGAGADVLVVREGGREGGRELLLPATPEVVKRVSLAEGRMVIEPPEGITEPEGTTPEGTTEEEAG
jgi:16S rRNA processing protein RimM